MLSTIRDSKQGWIRGLFFPTLICSALLHAGILWVPLPSEKKAAKPPEPKPQKTVPINQLVSLKAPSKKPLSPPKLRTKPIAVQPKLAPAKQVIHLNPKPIQKTLPKVAVKQPLPKPTTPPKVTPSPPPATPPEDTKDYSQEFQDAFNNYGSNSPDDQKVMKGRDVPYSTMPDPTKFLTAESVAQLESDPTAEPQTKPEVENILYQQNTRPDALVEPLKGMYPGYKFEEKGTFANGKLFEIRKGGTVKYLNLLKAKTGLGTFVAIWKVDPNKAQ